MQKIKTLIFIVSILIIINLVSAIEYTIPNYDKLPYKYGKSNADWSQYVNTNYEPTEGDWAVKDNNWSQKCLSYASSTVVDWFALASGRILDNYNSFINNKTENGTNPRVLETIYHYRHDNVDSGLYYYAPKIPFFFDGDLITGEYVPLNLKAYAEIIKNPPENWYDKDEPVFNDNYPTKYDLDTEILDHVGGYGEIAVSGNPSKDGSILKEKLKRYGILLMHGPGPSWYLGKPEHAYTLVGYDGSNFYAHDNQYGNSSDFFVKDITGVKKAFYFYDPQWPTENHDFRRTGFTLLKGDMKTQNDVEKTAFVLETNITQEQVLKPIVADIDGNGAMETVTFVHNINAPTQTNIYAVETKKVSGKKDPITTTKWKQTVTGGATMFPGTLADLDGESGSRKELITGVHNNSVGKVYAYNVGANGQSITQRWNYTLNSKWSPLASENAIRYNGGTAAVDIDKDGKNEIVLADGDADNEYEIKLRGDVL